MTLKHCTHKFLHREMNFQEGRAKYTELEREQFKKASETVQQNADVIVHHYSSLLMNSMRDGCRKEEVCSVPATARMLPSITEKEKDACTSTC